MTTSATPGANVRSLFAGATVYDLAHRLEANIPVSPNHPGFRMALVRRHGDYTRPDGGSAANELIVIGGHTGTHIDALCHVSHQGKLYGDLDAATVQRGGRFTQLGVESIPVIVCRGVLLDVATMHGVDVLPAGYPITAADLAAASERQDTPVQAGDAVLVRTGWSRHWSDPATFLGQVSGVPGPDEGAARWLAERHVRVTGAETTAYEHIAPGAGHSRLPVHRILLVESGILIIEMLDLESLARDHLYEFLFVVAPLKIAGATGSPVRPVAIV